MSIDRYTLPEMGDIWTDEYKFGTWLEVEVAVCEAQAELGYIPQEAVDEIKAKAQFDVKRILEIEAEVRHDVIAFLTNVNEYVGDAGRYIHKGMTSSDVLDTGLALQMVKSADLLLVSLDTAIEAIRVQARNHKNTICVGRSHGIHAEPMTFGFKLAGWLAEMLRNRDRLVAARESIAVGQISGAIGTYGNIDPQVEALTCKKLGLRVDKASTQVISRDVHAEFVQCMALIAASIERFAVEIRNLQRTDVLEVEEFFSKGQKGSSAMPHKRNPIRSERLTGLARVIRGNAVAALENVALWHERDISHSSVERMILPDSCTVLHFMLHELTNLVSKLLIYPENMERNMNLYGGAIFSQSVLLALVDKGLTREDAYAIVQSCAHEAWNKDGGNFRSLVEADDRVTSQLSAEEIATCFDPHRQLKSLDLVYERLGI
jgi:adenylosuccinate lyase